MDGVLDPIPLLVAEKGAAPKRKPPSNLVNPLLLVTEKKGVAYSLHYGAFPLDAFHTDGTNIVAQILSQLCILAVSHGYSW